MLRMTLADCMTWKRGILLPLYTHCSLLMHLPAKIPPLAYGAMTPTTLGSKAVQEGHASIPHFNNKDIGQVANRYWTKGRDCLYRGGEFQCCQDSVVTRWA